MQLWMNGQIVDEAQARISPLAHGFHYGTGVFEGIRAYPTDRGPAIFRLEEHLQRLGRGAACLGLPVDLAALRRGCLDVLAASGLEAAYLRPLVAWGTGSLALDVGDQTVVQLVAALPWKNHLEGSRHGVRACISSWRRNPAASLPALKLCGNYVNSILAKREATLAGFDEALFVDGDGRVVEATGENLFLVKQGRVTAVEHPDALPGITRQTVLELSGGEGRPVSLAELQAADEVFLTGTSAEIMPLGELQGHTWATGPVTRELQARYRDLVHGRVPDREAWLTRLPGSAAQQAGRAAPTASQPFGVST